MVRGSLEAIVPFHQQAFKRAVSAQLTDRSFPAYIQDLEIKPKDLGRFVLDLGSGEKERFAEGAKWYGINVISLNPQLALKETRLSRFGTIDNIKIK